MLAEVPQRNTFEAIAAHGNGLFMFLCSAVSLLLCFFQVSRIPQKSCFAAAFA